VWLFQGIYDREENSAFLIFDHSCLRDGHVSASPADSLWSKDGDCLSHKAKNAKRAIDAFRFLRQAAGL
jgi:hypothetical protein